jgi:hypothetical protein
VNTILSKMDHPYDTLKSLAEAGKLESIEDISNLLLSSENESIRVDTCCWLNGEDEYELDLKLNDSVKVTIAGPNKNAVKDTFATLLSLGLKRKNQTIVVKAFATQPRRVLPKLPCNGMTASVDASSNATLLIHFCGIPACPTWKNIFQNNVASLELRQCQIEDWNYIGSPSTLILSLTMPDFTAFGKSSVIATNVYTLRLVLHFCLQGDAWTTFCAMLFQSRDIQTLEIQYLDLLGDNEWELLWRNLPNSMQSVTMQFTDGFVDDHRRLTTERRLRRTKAVLDAVKAKENRSLALRSISFPEFQQDEVVMKEINAVLSSRVS